MSVDAHGEPTGCTQAFLKLAGGPGRSAVDRLFPVNYRPGDFYDGSCGRDTRECLLNTSAGRRQATVAYARGPHGVVAGIRLASDTGSELPDWVTAILAASDSVIVVLDRAGRFRRLNRAALLLTGYSADELAGKPFWETVLFEEDIVRVRTEFCRLVNGSEALSRFENRWRTKDGGERIFSWSNAVTRDSGGEVEYVVATAVDLTATRRHEEALASLSAEFMEALSAERQSISKYLHDTVSQYLVVLALTLSKLQREPDRSDPFEVAPTLDLVDRCCRDLRVISYALAPPVFEDAETAGVFDWYINHLREDAGVDVEFHARTLGREVSADVRKLLLAVMQEWAEKAIRVKLDGKTRIHLDTLASGVEMRLSSDQPENVAVTAVAASRIIRERVRALGGTLEIEPQQPGVSVTIFLDAV